MFKEQRQSSKLLKPGSFDVHKNVVAPIIVMLGHSELDIEILDVGIKTIESDDCREMLESDGNANSVLTVTQEEARFSSKDRQKFINLFIQSISRLCWASQLYSRTKEQKESSRVI